MLYRKPKITKFKWKQLFKNIFYFEVAVFGTSLYVWMKLCGDQNFRLSCHKHCSPLLFAFYKFMNTVGYEYQKIDYKKWGISEED